MKLLYYLISILFFVGCYSPFSSRLCSTYDGPKNENPFFYTDQIISDSKSDCWIYNQWSILGPIQFISDSSFRIEDTLRLYNKWSFDKMKFSVNDSSSSELSKLILSNNKTVKYRTIKFEDIGGHRGYPLNFQVAYKNGTDDEIEISNNISYDYFVPISPIQNQTLILRDSISGKTLFKMNLENCTFGVVIGIDYPFDRLHSMEYMNTNHIDLIGFDKNLDTFLVYMNDSYSLFRRSLPIKSKYYKDSFEN